MSDASETVAVGAKECNRLRAELTKAKREIERLTRKSCTWREDDNGAWETECGGVWEFADGGPDENGARYCFRCGSSVVPLGYYDRRDEEVR